MNSLRRIPLLVVLALLFAATGVVGSLSHAVNPSQLPSSLVPQNQVESTALYCTGLTSAKDGAAGHVTLLNTVNEVRHLTITIKSDTGLSSTRAAKIAPHGSLRFDPSAGLTGSDYGVEVQVSGGGVLGTEIPNAHTGESPCISNGVTSWYASGFDTTVGSRAELSVFNPTATPAVFNVSTYSSTGFVAPAKFQGYSVGPHDQAELNLGSQIVDMSDVGVRVKVLRGAIDIVGVQQSGSVVSFNAGVASPSTAALFPLVTTANLATAQLRISNPTSRPATVRFNVALAPFHIPVQSLSVAPFSSAVEVITPNPVIPAQRYATVRVSSKVPVVVTLATGTGTALALSAPGTPESAFLLSDFTGRGFDGATVTNTSPRAIALSFTVLSGNGSPPSTVAGSLSANTTANILTVLTTSKKRLLTTLQHATLLVVTARPVLLVMLTLPTKPIGMSVVAPLDGR